MSGFVQIPVSGDWIDCLVVAGVRVTKLDKGAQLEVLVVHDNQLAPFKIVPFKSRQEALKARDRFGTLVQYERDKVASMPDPFEDPDEDLEDEAAGAAPGSAIQ